MIAFTVLNTIPLSFLEDVGEDDPTEQINYDSSAVKPPHPEDISVADINSHYISLSPTATSGDTPSPETNSSLKPLAVDDVSLIPPDETPQLVRQTSKTPRVSKPPRIKPPKPSSKKVATPDVLDEIGSSLGSHSNNVEAETLTNPTVNVEGQVDTEPGRITSESPADVELEAAMSAAFEAADAELDGIQTLTDKIFNLSDPEKPAEVLVEEIADEVPVPEDISSHLSVNQTTRDARGGYQTASPHEVEQVEERVDFASLLVTPSDVETTSPPPEPMLGDAPSATPASADAISPTEGTADVPADPVPVPVSKPPPLSSSELLESQILLSKKPAPPKKKVALSKRQTLLLQKLQTVPLLLTRERLHDMKNRYKRISCGGTEVVEWRTWNDMIASADAGKLEATLPNHQPLLPALATRVRGSDCYNHTVYKRKNCTMSRELFADDPLLEDFPRPTCAVVGNSGRLRKEQHAARIEAADMVLRFNQGRTQGFEKIVGSKSSFRMFNAPFVSPKQPGEITVAQLRGDALRTWVSHVIRRGWDNSLAYVFDPEFLCHAWDWVGKQGKKPSSGLVGILLAMKICRRGQVSVFGFSYDDYFDKEARPHYFDWERPKPGREGVHPFAAERALLYALEAAGDLKLFIKPPPNQTAAG